MGTSTLSADWHPGVNVSAPAKQWMNFSEYLELCRASNMRPLVGVNYNCHNGKACPFNAGTANASVARAERQVRFALSKGFPGAFWYIGNEDSASMHSALILRHAVAMKKIDPTMKVFWNDNNLGPNQLKKFLKETGGVMDGAEFHGKWFVWLLLMLPLRCSFPVPDSMSTCRPYGGMPKGLPPFSYEQWLHEVPLLEHKREQSWRAKIAGLRAAAKEAGRPELLLANNEYGLGKAAAFDGSWNRFAKSMVVVELGLEMYVSGYDIACFWDNGDGGDTGVVSGAWGAGEHMLLSTHAGYRMNPMHLGLELLATSQNRSMLKVNTSADRVYGFATVPVAGQGGGGLEVLLINKFEQAQKVRLALPTALTRGATLQLTKMSSMVNSSDGWGELRGDAVCCAGGSCEFKLPPVSFSKLS